MKKYLVTLVIGVALGVAGSWYAPRYWAVEPDVLEEPAPEVISTLPDLPEAFYTVLFENDAVRVVEHRLEAGQTEPEHTHAPLVVYFVEPATVMITEADGTQSEIAVTAGMFLENLEWWTHALENTGDTPLHSIIVELKEVPPAS